MTAQVAHQPAYWKGACKRCEAPITRGSVLGYCKLCYAEVRTMDTGAIIAPLFVVRSWCNQCQRLVRENEARMCGSGFCKAKNLELADRIEAELYRSSIASKERG